MNIEEIKMDHFENFEELIKTCKMWIRDDDIDAYYRFFEFNCMKALVTAYEKKKEKREKLEYEATEAEEYIKGLKEKNKITKQMNENLIEALKESTSNDKIKAKIEEVHKDENASIPDFMEYAKEYATQKLQSLLEKE